MSREKRGSGEPKKPCCMVSEILEEAGIDRERARQIRRQVLEGVILHVPVAAPAHGARTGAAPPPGRRGRKIEVE